MRLTAVTAWLSCPEMMLIFESHPAALARFQHVFRIIVRSQDGTELVHAPAQIQIFCIRHECSYTRFHHPSVYVSIRQHTPAYVSVLQHTSAYVSMRQHAPAYVSIRQHPSASVSIRQHPSAYASIRQHTSAFLRQHERTLRALTAESTCTCCLRA